MKPSAKSRFYVLFDPMKGGQRENKDNTLGDSGVQAAGKSAVEEDLEYTGVSEVCLRVQLVLFLPVLTSYDSLPCTPTTQGFCKPVGASPLTL